ncbi:MAG: pantoate--beta-alanine ligase [Chitinophagaceae bacterium]|nr:pantoate--beta-alanine ligase [Chitinophagaceae bacterium]MBK9464725.1 pantoate--beta-alanine ligase [Chitinophagaceae bacterium]
MILFKKATDLRKWVDAQSKKGNSIAFVPTMGALHAGHISLIDAASKENQVTISSIFVNPTQFNDLKDFEKYPITIEKDIEMLEAAGCNVLFLPSVKEIYPEGIKPEMQYELGYIETILEGKFRPGHFQGVCMVVHRLLDIVQPDNLYLGQKDYQQCMVISKLVELINQQDTIKVNICPTLREKDGLAMSSRNMRLNEDERKLAAIIYRCLSYIKEHTGKQSVNDIKKQTQSMLEEAGLRVDYVEIAEAKHLSPITTWDEKEKAVALIAAFMNEVRLIDNMLLN